MGKDCHNGSWQGGSIFGKLNLMKWKWNWNGILIVTKRILRTNGRRKDSRDIFWRLLESILNMESQLTISEWNYLFVFFLSLILQGKL